MMDAGLFVILALYFLPALIAGARKHHNAAAIFLLNLLLGWTVLGWIVALVWSATAVNTATSRASRADSSEARPLPRIDDERTRYRPRDRSPVSKSSTAGAYGDPLVARFKYWPVFLIVLTVTSVGMAIIYINNDAFRYTEKQTPESIYSEEKQGDSASSLRRIGDPVVTAIPPVESTPTPSVQQPGPVHREQRPTSGTADDEALVWVTSDRLNRRTCPDVSCGTVGVFFFREGTEVFEDKNGWARVSKYYDAYCVNGLSKYVDSDNAACISSNGIVDGKFAEWVSLKYLSNTRPPDSSAGATGYYALVGGSDDYGKYKDVFARTAAQLIASSQCSEKDFKENGP